MPVTNFIIRDKISPSTFSAIGVPEVFSTKAQTTIGPLYGIKIPWQCGQRQRIVYKRCYFYSCISSPAILLAARSTRATSFATQGIPTRRFIGRPTPSWPSKNTTRAPTQSGRSNWYPVSYFWNSICSSSNICYWWRRCSRSSRVCVEKHRHRLTIHGPLGHSTRRYHRWRKCFPFDDHSVPWACKYGSRDRRLSSSDRLFRRCHQTKLLHEISHRRNIRAFFDHGRMTICQLF